MQFAPTLLLLTIALGDSTVGGPPADAEKARHFMRELGSQFSADYGIYFTVIADSVRKSSRIKMRADGVYWQVLALADRLELNSTPPEKKMTIVFFNKWEDYERYGNASGFAVNENAPGFFEHKSGVCFVYDYANSTLMREKRAIVDAILAKVDSGSVENATTEDLGNLFLVARKMKHELDMHERLINDTVIRHELAHQALYHLGIQTPRMKDLRWLCEGLAMQFEPVTGVNANRLADFREIDWSDPKLTVRTLITDSKLLGPGAEQPSVGYAAAWGLVHYLINEKPREFAAYVQLLQKPAPDRSSAAESDRASFAKCFGKPDAKFQLAWLEYMSALK